LPGSWFCVTAGLVGGAHLAPDVGADPAASDPAVRQARAAEEKAQLAYEKAHAAWGDAVAKHQAVERKAQRAPALFSGGVPVTPDRDMEQERLLRDRAEEAQADRDAVARWLVEARQATRAAEAACRAGRM
jgi:hypothetical protein